MNHIEVSDKSGIQLAIPDQERALYNYQMAIVLNAFDTSVLGQPAGLEVAKGGKIQRFYRPQNGPLANLVAVKPEDSEEIHFLTQVILNTLNTQPDCFHNMFDIPGLELESREQLIRVANYLIHQGWIELNATPDELLVKLTILGKHYLCANI